MTFLLAGISVRALAQSAARAGYRIAALDYFGDSDLPDAFPRRSLKGQGRAYYDARHLPDLADGLDYDGLVYAANLENHPRVLRQLADGRPIVGNGPEVLRKARCWPELRRVCAEEDLPLPPMILPGETAPSAPQARWLRKPTKSGGGHGIDFWDGRPLDAGSYLEAWIPGVAASAIFAADGRDCVILGISEQCIGHAALGARGFRHCGNILPLAPECGGGPELEAAVARMAAVLTGRFGLRGVCGLDFIVERGPRGVPRPVLLEINPRPTASAELVEERCLFSVFDAHVKASSGILPSAPPPADGYFGKGIAFAGRACRIPEDNAWLLPGLRDIGRSGDAIAPGQPVCSILVQGASRREALQALHAAALHIEQSLTAKEASP
jgi:predicted ATP-grasp superfamily ATP-dependent carboligase